MLIAKKARGIIDWFVENGLSFLIILLGLSLAMLYINAHHNEQRKDKDIQALIQQARDREKDQAAYRDKTDNIISSLQGQVTLMNGYIQQLITEVRGLGGIPTITGDGQGGFVATAPPKSTTTTTTTITTPPHKPSTTPTTTIPPPSPTPTPTSPPPPTPTIPPTTQPPAPPQPLLPPVTIPCILLCP